MGIYGIASVHNGLPLRNTVQLKIFAGQKIHLINYPYYKKYSGGKIFAHAEYKLPSQDENFIHKSKGQKGWIFLQVKIFSYKLYYVFHYQSTYEWTAQPRQMGHQSDVAHHHILDTGPSWGWTACSQPEHQSSYIHVQGRQCYQLVFHCLSHYNVIFYKCSGGFGGGGGGGGVPRIPWNPPLGWTYM